MNFTELQQFFNYKPLFEERPHFLVDEIKARASAYITGRDIEVIQKTYEFALDAHQNCKRLSGEPYIVHPLQATIFLMDLKPDLPTIQACILHDVIEDTDIPYETIEKEFGKEVADLCEGLVKVSKIKYRGEERQLEALKKTFLAMGKDLRVIFIKLADRIHNIQTLHYHPEEEKRLRIADETLHIYVPIAKRLGLYNYQQLLENGAFRILYPKECETIIHYLNTHFGNQEDIIAKGIKHLKQLLDEEHVPYTLVTGRFKSPYRIWEKLQHKYKSMDLENINDVIAFRIITNSVGDCYNVLGIVHNHYTPLIKKIKDYIAVPKFNDYKSLHTTVLGLYDFPVEIQIRTGEMEDIAQWGVAAHFAYAENKGATAVSERQAVWIKKLQDLVTTYTSNDDKDSFKHELNIEFLDRNIFAYTQKGDIVELPEGSTVLDFAFRIHSDLGLKFQSALVNGSIVPLSYKLKTGDLVVISAFKNKFSASGNWLIYLHTPSAKAKLTKFLKMKEKEQLITRSLKLLEEKLKEYKLPPLHSRNDLISKEYKGDAFDRLLLQLLDRQMGYYTFIKKIYKDKIPKQEISAVHPKITPVSDRIANVVIDGGMHLGYILCPECNPTIEDKIIARSGKDGIKIHCMDCVGVASVSPEKLLEAHWQDKSITRYTFNIVLQCQDQPGILLDIFSVLNSLNLNISKIHSETVATKMQDVYITSDTSYPSKIGYLLQEFKKREDSVKVVKREII